MSASSLKYNFTIVIIPIEYSTTKNVFEIQKSKLLFFSILNSFLIKDHRKNASVSVSI